MLKATRKQTASRTLTRSQLSTASGGTNWAYSIIKIDVDPGKGGNGPSQPADPKKPRRRRYFFDFVGFQLHMGANG